MYENLSYDTILNRMLDRIPDNIDKREGSIIMNSLAPAAVEIFMAYFELDKIINECFADTQSRSFLERRAAERAIYPLSASNAVWTATIVGDVEQGNRFLSGDLTFVVEEQTGINEYNVICEQSGSVGNVAEEYLFPIDFVQNLSYSKLKAIKVPARDEEDTEAFRTRYLSSLSEQAFGGNVADYKEKAMSISGVGGVKVIPVWNGAGTVKLVIVGANNQVPTDVFISEIQNIFDPQMGQGMGLAPIGHVCTISPVKTQAINITVNVSVKNSENILSKISEVIETYLNKLVSQWSASDTLTVRISQLESAVLDIEEVYDITGTTINGQEHNLVLEFDTIPIKGEVDAQIT